MNAVPLGTTGVTLVGTEFGQTLTGTTADDFLFGGPGGNSLFGLDGNDTIVASLDLNFLSGGAGNDNLQSNSGNDTLDGGTGADLMMDFGGGNTTYYIDNVGDVVSDHGGIDIAIISVSNVARGNLAGVETIQYVNGAEPLAYFIDSLVSGYSWQLGVDHPVLTFNFNSVPTPDLVGFRAYTEAEKVAVRAVFTELSGIIDMGFQELPENSSGEILLYLDDLTSGGYGGFGGYAWYPTVSDVHFNSLDSPSAGLIRHELGHALGLKHPFEFPTLPFLEDDRDFTIMSYSGFGSNYGIFDLAALHYLYGVSPTARTGNDTYHLADRYIWDGGGTDTLDLGTATAGALVDLTPGSFGHVGARTTSLLDAGQFYVGFDTDIENAIGGGYNDELRGNSLANMLQGGAGNDVLLGRDGADTLEGGTGLDTLTGGLGNDVYDIDNLGDLVVENAGEGTDLVNSRLGAYQLGANIENGRILASGTASLSGNTLANTLYAGAGANVLDGGAGLDTASYAFATSGVVVSLALAGAQATGGSGSDTLVAIENLVGSSHADTLSGNAAANVLNGGSGADRMSGGDGNDTYVVDNVGDVVTETNAAATGGTDVVYVGLAAYTLAANVENGRVTAAGTASLTGNTLANTLFAGAGNNVLDGGAGLDTVSYAYAAAAVSVSLALAGAQATGGSGSDTLVAIENLTGTAFADTLAGNAAANVLSGGAGADTLTGGDGSDTYTVDNIGDVVIESNALAAGGTDLVNSLLDAYTLGANVENGRVSASGTASLGGNTLANILYAGAGANVLDGGSGLDTASYAFATAGVSVSLALTGAQVTGGSGSDTLVSIENLTGSSYADRLTGNSAANLLTGGLGADTMTGGDGNDTYVVDNIGDVVTETNALAAGGTDQVNVTLAAYTLGASVENGRVLATGTASLTGNTLANTLFAGAGNNVLDGGAGLDTVSYAFAAAGVSVNLALAGAQATGGSGSDTLVAIENLTGSSFADTLTGNAAANVLNGGRGADTLAGGDGSDTYTVDNIADVVTETNTQPAGGTDLVNSLLGAYTLGSSVENGRVLVTGTASLTGNNLFNTLFAGAGDNVLDGGAGLDTASYAYATGAVSVSLALAGAQATGGSGSDTLVSIENLTGSSFADTLAGNAAANLVSGGTGADTLAGGAGLDTLIGGAGNDVFVFDTAPDGTANVDRITDFAAGDRISLDNDLYTALGAPGALAAGQFHSGAGLTGGTGSGGVYYNVSTGDVYYDPDGTGAAAAVRFASLTGAPALTAASFEVRD